ncbi:uncharacterized protein EV420DRAFT_1514787 [Desarmillaria tabescens]|uniref:Uncharacterized protein n=1 Tax=Armillaria tabescens TaxID=1929756 RepID=A0AA39NH39_ARMTA|nr:uncharacterized protein EV420DRAFT_1514787 [Desarmillaria tabescens]KAK0465531.1 hypothetical protein EV420DRAFT_1514787 [Desarmillaria tabescens]
MSTVFRSGFISFSIFAFNTTSLSLDTAGCARALEASAMLGSAVVAFATAGWGVVVAVFSAS